MSRLVIPLFFLCSAFFKIMVQSGEVAHTKYMLSVTGSIYKLNNSLITLANRQKRN